MTIEEHQRRAKLSWLFLGALFALCAILAILQYRWIGEVSIAARDRLHGSLAATLARLSRGFNTELATDCEALLPQNSQGDPQASEQDLASRFEQWKKVTRHGPLFRRVSMAIPQKQDLQLLSLDLNRGVLEESPWPAQWSGMKARLEARLSPNSWDNHNQTTPPGEAGPPSSRDDFTFEAPLFAPPAARNTPAPPRREIAWLIIELNPDYVRDVLLPEILQRYLGTGGSLDYQVEIVARTAGKPVIYRSDPGQSNIAASADASAALFDPQQFFWPSGRGPGPGRGPAPDSGHWQILVRHRAGSLEAVVSRARWSNLAIAAGVLLLIVATAAALTRFTRRTQKLAGLQMDFVAGVSHELRTPLTVIHTAAYNLQHKMAHDPAQVERYGALIQQESGRLNALVEQILQFAAAEKGRVIREREPLSISTVIEEAVTASKPLIDGSHCVIEKNIAPGLPQVLGDRAALRQALENLVANAAKYGLKGGNWIGVFASRSQDPSRQALEIRVADHGPGIPREEQEQIFDPFFRGARALDDQIRGTGLGLSLVKKIVEAHGGSIRVESEPAKGTVFIMHLPTAPAGAAV